MVDRTAVIGRPPVVVNFGENTAEAIRQRQIIEGLLQDEGFNDVVENLPNINAVAAVTADIATLAPYAEDIGDAATLVKTAHPFDHMEGHAGLDLDTVFVAGAGLEQYVTLALTTDGKTFFSIHPDAPANDDIRALIETQVRGDIDYATNLAERNKTLIAHETELRTGIPRADWFVDSVNGSDQWGGETLQRPKKSIASLAASAPFWGVLGISISGAGAGMADDAYWANITGGTVYEPANYRYYVEGGVTSGSVSTKNKRTSPGKYARGSSAPTVTMAGSGTGTPATATVSDFGPAFQPGDTFGFFHDSYLRETFHPKVPGLNFIDIPKLGATRLSILDGADVIPKNIISASAHVDAGGVVYEFPWVIDTATGGLSSNNGQAYTIWQNNSPDEPWLMDLTWYKWVASVALCAAEPGTYHYPVTDGAITGNGATPITIYVHPLGSADPTDPDGPVLETQKRYNPLELTRTDGCTVEGLAIIRPFGNNGFNSGRDLLMRRCMVGMGTAHDAVPKSGRAEDCISWDGDQQGEVARGGGGNHTSWVWYTESGEGLSGEWVRHMALAPDRGGPLLSEPFLAHTSTPTYYDRILNLGCIVQGHSRLSGTMQTYQLHQIGNVLFPATGWGLVSPQARDMQVSENIANFTSAISTFALNFSGFRNSGADVERLIVENNAWKHNAQPGSGGLLTVQQALPIKLRNQVIVNRHSAAPVSLGTVLPAGAEYRDNIVICGSSQNSTWQRGLSAHTGNADKIDYNVYIRLNGSDTLWWHRADGNSNVTSLAAWKALGFDLNSVVLTEAEGNDLFLTGVAGALAGDYRLNPYCDLRFTDNTPIVARAGIRKYYDHNLRRIMPGQPWRLPRVPETLAECHQFLLNPLAWNFYP
ncbi:MAG TPA: hypothetical protein PKD48_02015 [Sphingopyxis sp.]|nr:hypothetical protein [Sphingopyxis sp.]